MKGPSYVGKMHHTWRYLGPPTPSLEFLSQDVFTHFKNAIAPELKCACNQIPAPYVEHIKKTQLGHGFIEPALVLERKVISCE